MNTSSDFLDACSIDTAKDSNTSEICDVIKDALTHYRGSVYPDFSSHLELENPKTSAEVRGGKAIVACFDERIVGFGFVHRGFASYIIDHLYVSSVHQNKGLGMTMLIELTAFALDYPLKDEHAHTCIETWVDSKLNNAIAFFEQAGFVKNGEQRRRLKKLPHLSEDERDASSVEICMMLLLAPQEEHEEHIESQTQ